MKRSEGFYNHSENRSSVYDEIDNALNEHYIIKFNENALDFELIDKETEVKIEFNFSSLLIHLKREKIKVSEKALKTYLTSHFVEHYNPIKEYFKNLKYNGKQNIKQFSSYVKTDDDEFFYTQLKKWAVRAVKTVFDENEINKHCIVLANGAQNAGKSTYLEYLVPEELRQYYYSNIGVEKDDRIKLCKAFIINIEEMDVFGRKDVNSIKSLISQKYVNERLPYGSKSELMHRICSFVGSTNRLEFLTDDTGSVRWITFDVMGQINWDYSKEFNVDDFWAEAYHIYTNKPDYNSDLTLAEIDENEKRNERYTVQTPEQEFILRFYEHSDNIEDFRTATDILRELEPLRQRLSNVKIGSILTKYKYQRVKHPKKQVYGYLAKKKFLHSPTELIYKNKVT